MGFFRLVLYLSLIDWYADRFELESDRECQVRPAGGIDDGYSPLLAYSRVLRDDSDEKTDHIIGIEAVRACLLREEHGKPSEQFPAGTVDEAPRMTEAYRLETGYVQRIAVDVFFFDLRGDPRHFQHIFERYVRLDRITHGRIDILELPRRGEHFHRCHLVLERLDHELLPSGAIEVAGRMSTARIFQGLIAIEMLQPCRYIDNSISPVFGRILSIVEALWNIDVNASNRIYQGAESAEIDHRVHADIFPGYLTDDLHEMDHGSFFTE